MDKKKTIWSGITGVVASVLAFLGVVSCCGMPIIAGILATVGIGASQLSFFCRIQRMVYSLCHHISDIRILSGIFQEKELLLF